MHRRACSILALFTCLLLAACTPPGAPSPSGSGSGTPTSATSASRSASPGTPSSVGDQTWQTNQFVANDPDRPVFATWPIVPDAAALTAAIDTWVDDRIARFQQENAPSTTAPPELNLSWVATIDQPGGVIGVRMLDYEFSGASAANTSRTWHTLGDAVWTGSDLIEASQVTGAIDAIVAQLRADGYTPLDDSVASSEALQDLTFTRSGELVVEVPEGVLLPFSDGRVAVKLSADRTGDLLSADGRTVRDAYAEVGPAATATPTASTSTSSTPSASASATPSASRTASTTPSATTPSSPAAPTTAAATAPSGSVDCSQVKCVALTFDDGPRPDTARLLDLLAARKVPATFFVLGQNAQRQPALVARMVAEGHEVGNHTFDHKQLTKLGRDGQASEINRGAAAIKAAGATPTVFRPPYGSYDETTKALAGLPIITWNVDTLDWKHKSPAQTLAAVQKSTKRGSIILMHDVHPTSIDAVPAVLDWLQQQGYTLVTVSTLIGNPQPGVVYSQGQR